MGEGTDWTFEDKVGGVGVGPGKRLHLWFPGEQQIEESDWMQAQVAPLHRYREQSCATSLFDQHCPSFLVVIDINSELDSTSRPMIFIDPNLSYFSHRTSCISVISLCDSWFRFTLRNCRISLCIFRLLPYCSYFFDILSRRILDSCFFKAIASWFEEGKIDYPFVK